jgi:23S rRNA (uracil1939-C5)-methyltransferase
MPRGTEVRIESLAAGGEGVGRLPDGRAVFVPFTAPGDRVLVRVREDRGRFARGQVEALLEPGPARADPVCPVFGSCGGCAWQHVSYAAQLEAKRAILAEALRRLGGLEPLALPPCAPSPRPYAYRGRTRLQVAAGRVGYRRRRSHALCAVERCPVLVPALDEALHELAAHPPPEDGEWELVAGADATRVAALGRGAAPVELEVCGRRLGVSAGVFAQSNALLLDELVRRVATAAGRGALAVELFAGAGLFSAELAARFSRVIAVESDGAAAADLRRNLGAWGFPGVEVLEERVERALPRLAGLEPDALVLDPPRSGLPRGAAEALLALRPRRVVYLSCDPATLARDLARLVAGGLALRSAAAIDLFPQTPHVEALATLSRDGAGAAPQALE